jgi:SOS-response transcriptional repressor LexA
MAKKYPKLSSTLKNLLFHKDMKTMDLARALDIPQPTIHRLVTGKTTRPYRSSLEPIADFFDISVDQLLGETPMPSAASTPPSPLSVKTIPIIHWENAHATEAQHREPLSEIIVSGDLSTDTFALVMMDTSMEPLFPKMSLLIFDPSATLHDRSYVLVQLAHQTTPIFRQLLIDADQRYLKPLNADLNAFQMRLMNDDDQIIATLVESRLTHRASDLQKIMEN